MFQRLMNRWKIFLLLPPILMVTEQEIADLYESKGHGAVAAYSVSFEESARDLDNPDRGFYHMHGFRITEKKTDFAEAMKKRFGNDDTVLTLVEVNLQEYTKKAIGETGINNLENLFAELEKTDKNFIVRFLYDWDGKNLKNEPQDLEIILGHMRQAAEVVNRHKDRIFLLQGLFTGNCGEMNSTIYSGTDDMKRLAECLNEVIDPSIFFSVRTPLQWRQITDTLETEITAGNALADRLGLFNDGMLGNRTDWGTYGAGSRETDGFYIAWKREEELTFQDILCRVVPNGGEVIVSNEYNDLENALRDLRTMHVTYLNEDYDQKVLNKWKAAKVQEDSCFDGMDGKTYIERHLGYRFLIDEAYLSYAFKKDILSIDVTMKNVGFAPIYRPADLYLTICRESGEIVCQILLDEDVRALAGGNDAETGLICHEEISLSRWQEDSYRVCFELKDQISGQRLLFANTADPEEYGYLIGEFSVGNMEEAIGQGKEERRERRTRLWQLE